MGIEKMIYLLSFCIRIGMIRIKKMGIINKNRVSWSKRKRMFRRILMPKNRNRSKKISNRFSSLSKNNQIKIKINILIKMIKRNLNGSKNPKILIKIYKNPQLNLFNHKNNKLNKVIKIFVLLIDTI